MVIEEGTYQKYSHIVAELLSDMVVFVTKPAMERVGVASIFSEKVAVSVTTPEVMIVSVFIPSSTESVKVAV